MSEQDIVQRLRDHAKWADGWDEMIDGDLIREAADVIERMRLASVPRDPNWCPICTPKGLGYCQCDPCSTE